MAVESDIWGIAELVREIALGAVGLLATIGILVVRRQNKKIDECKENHVHNELFASKLENIDLKFAHLSAGIDSLHDRLDDIVPRRTERRDDERH